MDQSVIDVDSFRFVSGKRLLTILLIDEVWRSSKVERRRVFFLWRNGDSIDWTSLSFLYRNNEEKKESLYQFRHICIECVSDVETACHCVVLTFFFCPACSSVEIETRMCNKTHG